MGLELRTKTLSTLRNSFSYPIALLSADIISLGPHVHFCPEPSRESSWKLSTASTTPKSFTTPTGSIQLGTAVTSFYFFSCQLERRAKKKDLILHLQVLRGDLKESEIWPFHSTRKSPSHHP